MIASRGSVSESGDFERRSEFVVSLLLVTRSGSDWRELGCEREADDGDVEERLFRRV